MAFRFYTSNLVAYSCQPCLLTGADGSILATIALGLVLVGFGFKVSAAPFHFAAPDAYAGANSPVAGVLATASKAMGMIGSNSNSFVVALPDTQTDGSAIWIYALATLSVVTMTWGNLLLWVQPILSVC